MNEHNIFLINRTHYLGVWENNECVDSDPDIYNVIFNDTFHFDSIDDAIIFTKKLFENEDLSEPTEQYKNMIQYYIFHPKIDHINMDIIEIRKGILKKESTGVKMFYPYKYDNDDVE